jgi:hypothetical protein
MRLSTWLTVLIAILATGALLVVARLVLRPGGPALAQAAFSPAAITPNADGSQDVTRITYRLRRPASVSIYFIDAQGRRFDFRDDQPRDAGEHQVDFSGVVDPYRLPDDDFNAELLARVMPDGAYTWVIEAREAGAPAGQFAGTLNVSDAESQLPDLWFAGTPSVFTPNQDGLDDRAAINVWLDKDIAEGGLRLDLVGAEGAATPIGEQATAIKAGQRGLHAFDYDGGIDNGLNPPPDGTYTLRAQAEDRLGQKMAATTQLTLKFGGLPRAQIMLGEVQFSATTLVLGETLYFTLTVENYGTAPIRTSGPPSGTVYDSMSANANTLGWYEESGAWRVGVDCDTCLRDYPWRWALGTPDTLTNIPDASGRPQSYLMPGERVTVTGGVVLDNIIESRNPQYFWAGLIHEDVGIDLVNNHVDPRQIEIVPKR